MGREGRKQGRRLYCTNFQVSKLSPLASFRFFSVIFFVVFFSFLSFFPFLFFLCPPSLPPPFVSVGPHVPSLFLLVFFCLFPFLSFFVVVFV